MAWGHKTGGGSRKGRPNKVDANFRATVDRLLVENRHNFSRWLTEVAEGCEEKGIKPDPGRAVDLLTKLAEFAAPKLQRTEVIPIKPPPLIDVSRLTYEQREQLRELMLAAMNKQEAIEGQTFEGEVDEGT